MIKMKKEKTDDFILFLNSSLSFAPNYSDIKHKINEEQFMKKRNQKIDTLKYLKLTMYTIIICIASVFTTILVINPTPSSNTDDINPGKLDAEYLENNFDNFFAFGCGSVPGSFLLDVIIESNLISDNDKEELIKYKNRSSKYCTVYLGEKNGVDIVQIETLEKPYKTFTFNSNLDYSFNEVLEMFEELSQTKIEKQFLYDSVWDDVLRRELSGILVEFKKDGDLYVPYYTMLLDGKMYVVNK